jgi:hypothetical protein
MPSVQLPDIDFDAIHHGGGFFGLGGGDLYIKASDVSAWLTGCAEALDGTEAHVDVPRTVRTLRNCIDMAIQATKR